MRGIHMAHDVFISHSAKDKPIADAVCATLEMDGIRCWIAPRDIVPGTQWGEAIIDAISMSSVMVLVFSSNANESQQIIREVERAVSKGIPVIPFRVEDVDPNKSLEYFISAPHWLDALTPPLEKHMGQLSSTIKLLLARKEGRPVPEPGQDTDKGAGVKNPISDERLETIRPIDKGAGKGVGGPKKSFLDNLDAKKVMGIVLGLIIILGAAYFLIDRDGDSKNDDSDVVVPPVTTYAPPPPPVDHGGTWGALALAPNGGWGFSTTMQTKEAAEQEAMTRCSEFNTGCEMRISFSNCAVYATAPDGSWGWATESTVDLARGNAVSECHKYTKETCASFIELCGDGSVRRVNVWAAIATADNGQYGVAWNFATRPQAEKAAVEECTKHGPNCQSRISYTECGAVARGEDGALGWAYYTDMGQAVKGAIEECENRSEKSCSVLAQLCADGSQKN